jgi:hypothetical protein
MFRRRGRSRQDELSSANIWRQGREGFPSGYYAPMKDAFRGKVAAKAGCYAARAHYVDDRGGTGRQG